jgi:uncharacterized membrane protein
MLDKFKNFIKKKEVEKAKVGDYVICIKNFKFIKEFDISDYTYLSKTGDNSFVNDLVKGRTYLFEKDSEYKIIEMDGNIIKIESDVDKCGGNGKQIQTFIFKSYISKYETEYYPIFSDYFNFK